MNEELMNAKQELKRVDHLIFVSLKYTRTADVLKNVVLRLINSYEFIVDSLLVMASENGKIKEIPTAPMLKVEELKKLFPDDKALTEKLDFYVLLRKIKNAEYEAENEFRRHVTMRTKIDGNEIDINIDIVTDYYKDTKQFIEYIESTYADND